MSYYAIYSTDNPDNNINKRRTVRPAHLERIQQLKQENRLLTAGPLFQQDGPTLYEQGIHGSLIIAQFDSLEDAKIWASLDPYVTAGIYTNTYIYPYQPADL